MSLLNPEAEIYGINESLRSYSREQLCNWLAEKGVDVGLAVRIVTEANVANTEVVVVSANTDLLPAFQAAAKLGARLVHIGYEHQPIASLSRAANATRTITIPLEQKFRQLQR